jgi:hypothetical protein
MHSSISVVFSPLCRANSPKRDYMGYVWAISVPAKRVDSASYSRGPGKAGQLALHVIEMSK